jgi:hypothetical protein
MPPAAQIFLRAGQMAELDKIRTELLNRSAVILQRHVRGFVARSKYRRQRRAIVTLQVGPIGILPPCTCAAAALDGFAYLGLCPLACCCDDGVVLPPLPTAMVLPCDTFLRSGSSLI